MELDKMNEIVDLLFGVATFLFCISVFSQIFKNYKVKKVTSQSIIWHILTIIGLSLILIGHIIGGYWLSAYVTIFNIIQRIVLIIQIKIYWV